MARLSKSEKKMIDSMKDPAPEKAQENKNGNYFLAAAKRNAYLTNPEPHRQYRALIEAERKYRHTITMETMSFFDKVRSTIGYYWSSKGTGIPSMGTILSKTLQEIVSTTSELDRITNQIESTLNSLHEYYFTVIKDADDCDLKMKSAGEQRTLCKRVISEYDAALGETTDFQKKIALMGERYRQVIAYRHSTVDWVCNGFKRDLRMQQTQDLEGTGGFLNAVRISARLSMTFSVVIGEHFNQMKPIYDFLPEEIKQVTGLEKFQKRLSDHISGYKELLADFYKMDQEKVRSLLAPDTAAKLIGEDSYRNIEALKTTPGG